MGSKLSEGIAELVVSVIGWGLCITFVGGFFFIGWRTARFFGGAEHRETFGLLSAIAFIWLYEHRAAHDQWERLNERLDYLASR